MLLQRQAAVAAVAAAVATRVEYSVPEQYSVPAVFGSFTGRVGRESIESDSFNTLSGCCYGSRRPKQQLAL